VQCEIALAGNLYALSRSMNKAKQEPLCKPACAAFHHSDNRHLENAPHFLDAGIRQMPAGAQKQPLVSKAHSGCLLCAFRRLSHCFRDYSMIVATAPEPTVLPPSRYLNSVFYVFSVF
jgi:hypothetical protein